jgi:tetratricopeptide (TPR) repeat protein
LLTFSLLTATMLSAQSVDEARKAIYYEQYDRAASIAGAVTAKEANAEAAFLQVRAALLDKDMEQARSLVAALPAEVKESPWGSVAAGHLELATGNAAAAGTHFDKALDETREKNAEILLSIAQAHIDYKAGDAQRALALLGKAVRRDKRNPALHTAAGNAYRKLDNGTEAYKAYKEALSHDAKYAEALTEIGNIFVTQKNPDVYLNYFNEAVAADPGYAPAYYDLYLHYYFRDPAKATENFNQYVTHSDPSPEHDYLRTDLLYLTKQYDEAIRQATALVQKDPGAHPRLHKLIAYSHAELKDTAAALHHMQQYFALAPDTGFVLKDFETMGQLYASREDGKDSAIWYFTQALDYQKDSTELYAYYKKLADFHKEGKDFKGQAQWLGRYYTGNAKATNVDLFNWGIAAYRAEDFDQADTVFGTYIREYPEQGFGYYWRARANAARPDAMEQGLAVPHYEKLVAVIGDSTADETNRKWLVEAYGYLAAYETNVEKDYAGGISYFRRLLEVDPENKDARKYISILEKNMQAGAPTASGSR